MKVFFILDNAFPSNNPSAKRVKCYCKGLNYHGIETEILTISQKGNPEENEGLLFKNIGVGHSGSMFSKIKALYINIRELKQYIDNNSAPNDIVFLYSDGFIIGLLPIFLGGKRKYVRELCEIPYYSQKINSRINRWIYLHYFFRLYDGIVAISASLERIAYKYKKSSCKVIKVPILVDFSKYGKDRTENEESNVIFHSGSHTEAKDGFFGMIKSIGLVKEKYGMNIDFYCTGNEPEINEYDKLVENYKLRENIHYLGYISEKELLFWQKRSKLFIINKYDTFQNRYCFATKLGEYLAMGKPVITTNIGEIVYYLINGENAIIVQPNKPDSIAKSIAEVFNDTDQYAKIGHNGRLLAKEKFDCIKNGLLLKNFIKNLI